MPNYKISGLTAYPNSTFATTDRFEVSYYSGGIYYSRYLTGTQILATIPSGLTIGTTAITSGTVGRILFEGTGNVVQQDSTLFWDNTNKRLGVGATPNTSTRLDVRAQGALSTDIGFRVRNSADTDNIIQANGDNSVNILGANGSFKFYKNTGASATIEHIATSTLPSIFTLKSAGGGGSVPQIRIDANGYGPNSYTFQRFLFGLSNLDGSALNASFGSAFSACFIMENSNGFASYGTIPSTTPANHFAMYSADIVAGNAAPHFRTENGDIVKLFKGAVLTTSDGTLANAVIRIGELEARLQALGLLA